MKTGTVIEYLLDKYPLHYASDFDNGKLGLVIGSKNFELKKIMLTLDLNLDVVNNAINEGCNLIISHHPYFFHPITKINLDSEMGQVIKKMVINDISLYSMHTNFDVLNGGVNDTLTKLLKLEDVKIINGEVGKDNFLRYGKLPNPMTFEELIKYVKKHFSNEYEEIDKVKCVGRFDKIIRTVGVVGGGGGSEKDTNEAKNYCDCYISGEFRLSSGQIAKSSGLCLIEVKHGIEKLSMVPLKKELEVEFGIDVVITKINTDPFIIR